MSTNVRHQLIESIYQKRPDFYTDIRPFNSLQKIKNRINDIDAECRNDTNCYEEKEKMAMERLLLVNKLQFYYYTPGLLESDSVDRLFELTLKVLGVTSTKNLDPQIDSELKRRHTVVLLHPIYCDTPNELLL